MERGERSLVSVTRNRGEPIGEVRGRQRLGRQALGQLLLHDDVALRLGQADLLDRGGRPTGQVDFFDIWG